MADELNLDWRFALNEADSDLSKLQIVKEILRGRMRLDISTEIHVAGSPLIGTTYEALPLGDVTTPGWGYAINLDDTNYIEVGIEIAVTFHPFLRLRPGEGHPVAWGAAAPQALANTAPARLEYLIVQA